MYFIVNSFVELTHYLLELPEVSGHYLLSERFSQDPVENYFSRQRAAGGYNQNPSVQQCIRNAQSLRVQGSHALNPVRGNSSRKCRLFQDSEIIDETPLPKRKRKTPQKL